MSDPNPVAPRPGDATEAELRAWLQTHPGDVETLRALAVHCAGGGRYDEAGEWIEQALAAQPNDLRMLLSAAGIAANGGDLDHAERQYRKALALRDDLAPAHTGLGQIAETREQWVSAEEHFRHALKAETDQVDALLGLGRVRMAQGDVEQAVQLFGRATQLYPQHARALTYYGQALMLRGTPQVAARPLIRALELDPSLHEARILLGQVELGRGRFDAAEQAYRQAAAATGSAAARTGLADALRAQGRLGEALAVYDSVLAEMPDNETLLAAHALCLASGGRADAAVQELREFIARHPRATAPRQLLADICDSSNRSDEALALWREGAERDADDVLAHAEWALRLEAAGDYAGAAAASKGSTTDRRPATALMRARVALRDGDDARAQRELLALAPRMLPPLAARDRYRLLGLVHDRQGRHAEATLAFREAHRVDAAPLPTIADPEQVARLLKPLLAEPELETPRLPAPVLLLGLPGSGVERVAALLADQQGIGVREDRFAGHFDLFGDADDPRMLVAATQQQLSVQARRYARGLERQFGQAPGVVVDWIPAFDARVLAQAKRALPGLRAIVVETDPERAFLDWLAFGYQRAFRIVDPLDGAQWWRAARGQIELAAAALPTLRVDADALLADPAAAGKPLAEFLGLAEIRPGPRSAARNEPRGGLPTRFEPRHAEHYRNVLAEAFAALR